MPRAPGSPRRHSSRQLPTASHSNSASSTSSASAPAERSTRSAQKQASPHKSSTPHSLSSEERQQDPAARSQPRRSRRQQDSVDLTATVKVGDPDMDDDDDDEIVEDEETTRCVCGQLDYPGPPVDASPRAGRSSSKSHAAPSVTDPDGQSDEAGGLFIQCDSCKVWQHGGCVGIMDEAASPENYFCEECKPEFHQVLKSITGQMFSRYLPVVQKLNPKSHRKPSVTKDWDIRASRELERTLKHASAAEATKRRSTMNSRAAYDEDEVLRKVLEESKVEDATAVSETGTKKGKRARDESEDMRSDVKRQRTMSVERSLSTGSRDESPGVTSDQDPTKKKQAPRGAAARSQREKELREKERERAEAANKRKGRAERRRADEEEEERLKALNDPPAEDTPASQPPDTPSGSTVGNATGAGPRRGPRPGGKRGRGGRGGFANRDNHGGHDSGSPAGGKNGKEKSASPKDPTDGPGSGADSSATTNAPAPPTRRGRPSHQSANGGPREPTMAELKRKAAAMLEFITQSQIEMTRTETRGLGVNGFAASSGSIAESNSVGGRSPSKRSSGSPAAGLAGDLATRLVKWQQDFTMEGGGASTESGGK